MKKWWKKVRRVLLVKEEDLSPVQRRAFLAVNLVLMTLLLWMIWVELGYPLPTMELEFRRMERTHLLPPGEIVFAAEGRSGHRVDQEVCAADGTRLYLRGSWYVSLGEDWAAVALMEQSKWDRFLQTYPLEPEGATLLNFYSGYGYWREEAPLRGHRETHNFFPLLLVDVPEETAQAEVTVTKDGVSVTGPGWNMGNGVWLLTPDNQVLPYQTDGVETYTLTLYRADGSPLLERSGTLEEG